MQQMNRNQKTVLAIILALGIFLIFFRLGRQDMLSDEPLYNLRAIHYVDYLASVRQTTPLQWFGDRPSWTYLSFHDHPPLYEIIQHSFFWLFGDSVVVGRLTSALAAAGSIIVMLFIGRRFGGAHAGLAAMGALVLNNFFIWLGRIGLLESLMIFWILLGLLFLLKAVEERPVFFLWSGVFFGAAFMTKYTVLFVLPAVLLFLLIRQRRVFAEKKFWLGVLLFLLVISPVLFYNFKMYEVRGHFDALFADLFGQENQDWIGLSDRIGGWRFGTAEIFRNLISGLSWPYFIFCAAAFVAALAWIWRGKQRQLLLPVLVVIFLFLFFSYLGGVNRWVGVMSPFLSLILAVVFASLRRVRLVQIAATASAVYFLLFIFNTNHALAAPKHSLLFSSQRLENVGLGQLDERLNQLLSGKRPDPAVAEAVHEIWYEGIKKEAMSFAAPQDGEIFPYLIVFDDNLHWSAVAWIFERRKLYRRFFMASADEYLAYWANEPTRTVLASLPKDLGVYFIKAGPAAQKSPEESYEAGIMQKRFVGQGILPAIIYDDKGREAFYLYDGLRK